MAKVTGKRLAVLAGRDAKALQSIMDRVQPGAVIAAAVDRHIADAARNVGRARALGRAVDMLRHIADAAKIVGRARASSQAIFRVLREKAPGQ